MKKLLLSVLSILMIACHQPDTPPYSYSMNIDMQIISSLETTYPLDNLETVIINSTLELASSSYRIKTLISSNDLQVNWLGRPIVMQGKEEHRYLSLPITLNEENDRCNVKIDFYCPEIFKDDKYHTINIIYSIVKGKYLYNLESFTLDSNTGEIKNQGENNAPIIVFSIPTTEKKKE